MTNILSSCLREVTTRVVAAQSSRGTVEVLDDAVADDTRPGRDAVTPEGEGAGDVVEVDDDIYVGATSDEKADGGGGLLKTEER
ncbi:MAG: hypothetical protein WKF76_02235 [Nocardioidaceae bacterium]